MSSTEAVGEQLLAMLPKLRRFARTLTGSADEGDDLLQSACMRALERADQFVGGTRFDSWMYRIVQTIWIDRVRHMRHREKSVDPSELADFPAGAGSREVEDKI